MLREFKLIALIICAHLLLSSSQSPAQYIRQAGTSVSDKVEEWQRLLYSSLDSFSQQVSHEDIIPNEKSIQKKENLEKKLHSWREQLFPQTMLPSRNGSIERPMRKLAIEKEAYDPDNPVPCVACTNLQTCSALNGLLIEEKYYPNNPEQRETCSVIEVFGNRISREIFGNGRTFRDTPQCRDIVMQYLCLFYGSDSPMYRNYCIFQEIIAPLDGDTVLAPKPPCKSFCVQISTVCANDPEFIQVCNDIKCPPVEETCTPDPQISGVVLAANLGCDVPYYRSPYNTAARLGTGSWTNCVLAILFAVLTSTALMWQ